MRRSSQNAKLCVNCMEFHTILQHYAYIIALFIHPCRNGNVADHQCAQNDHSMADGVPQSHGFQAVSTNTEYSSVRIHHIMIFSLTLWHDGHTRHCPEGGRSYLPAGTSQMLSAIHTMTHPAPTNPKSTRLKSQSLYLVCAAMGKETALCNQSYVVCVRPRRQNKCWH